MCDLEERPHIQGSIKILAGCPKSIRCFSVMMAFWTPSVVTSDVCSGNHQLLIAIKNRTGRFLSERLMLGHLLRPALPHLPRDIFSFVFNRFSSMFPSFSGESHQSLPEFSQCRSALLNFARPFASLIRFSRNVVGYNQIMQHKNKTKFLATRRGANNTQHLDCKSNASRYLNIAGMTSSRTTRRSSFYTLSGGESISLLVVLPFDRGKSRKSAGDCWACSRFSTSGFD